MDDFNIWSDTYNQEPFPWWRHQMVPFSALLDLCEGNSPVTQRPATRSFDVLLCLNKRLSKQSWGWWFEMSLRSLWRHCNALKIPKDLLLSPRPPINVGPDNELVSQSNKPLPESNLPRYFNHYYVPRPQRFGINTFYCFPFNDTWGDKLKQH